MDKRIMFSLSNAHNHHVAGLVMQTIPPFKFIAFLTTGKVFYGYFYLTVGLELRMTLTKPSWGYYADDTNIIRLGSTPPAFNVGLIGKDR